MFSQSPFQFCTIVDVVHALPGPLSIKILPAGQWLYGKQLLSPRGLSLVLGGCLAPCTIRQGVTVNACNCSPQQIMYQRGGKITQPFLLFGWNNTEVNSTPTCRDTQCKCARSTHGGNCSLTLPELASLCWLLLTLLRTLPEITSQTTGSQDLISGSAIGEPQSNTYP